MGMTMTQKILARAAGVPSCSAGELLMCKLDMVDRGRIVFGEEFIPISESYKAEVQRFLDGHTLM